MEERHIVLLDFKPNYYHNNDGTCEVVTNREPSKELLVNSKGEGLMLKLASLLEKPYSE